jgi:hypothetical protein
MKKGESGQEKLGDSRTGETEAGLPVELTRARL